MESSHIAQEKKEIIKGIFSRRWTMRGIRDGLPRDADRRQLSKHNSKKHALSRQDGFEEGHKETKGLGRKCA